MSVRQCMVFNAIGSFAQKIRTENSSLRSFSQQFSEYIAFAYVVFKIESCRNIKCLKGLYNINMYTTFNGLCATAHNALSASCSWRAIQGKLPLERTIRRPALPLEERNDLRQHVIEVHQHPSTCASAASVSGSQKVISIDRYISMAVDNAIRAGSRWPLVV